MYRPKGEGSGQEVVCLPEEAWRGDALTRIAHLLGGEGEEGHAQTRRGEIIHLPRGEGRSLIYQKGRGKGVHILTRTLQDPCKQIDNHQDHQFAGPRTHSTSLM